MNQETVRSWLDYNPETGVFTWKKAPGRKIRIGSIAGGIYDQYRRIRIEGKQYFAHRLAFLWMTGKFPDHFVDHRDCDRDNNRWSNLREADDSMNAHNRRWAQKNSTTGFLGVHHSSPDCKNFRARIRIDGMRFSIGSFPTPEEAYAAYVRWKRVFHPGCTL